MSSQPSTQGRTQKSSIIQLLQTIFNPTWKKTKANNNIKPITTSAQQVSFKHYIKLDNTYRVKKIQCQMWSNLGVDWLKSTDYPYCAISCLAPDNRGLHNHKKARNFNRPKYRNRKLNLSCRTEPTIRVKAEWKPNTLKTLARFFTHPIQRSQLY